VATCPATRAGAVLESRAGVAAEQADLQQRAGLRPLRHHPDDQHEAVVPGRDAEARLFDMIARRFVAVFHPSAEFDVTTRISTVAKTFSFKTEGKVLTSPGWLAVYGKTALDEDAADAKALPALCARGQVEGQDPRGASSTRKAPSRRRATRRRRCSPPWRAPASSIDDEELAEAMKERGLGTPATRADTIEGLINQKYLDRETSGNSCQPPRPSSSSSSSARSRLTNLTKPAMTGEWEFHLREMEHNKYCARTFMAEIVKETRGHRGAREVLRGG
jgi:DNA topoisomerase-3